MAVEILLTDFLARKAVFPEGTLKRGPEVLRAFVRFAHDERGIRSELTAQTLEGVERHTPEFLDQLGGDRQGLGHLLTDLLADHGIDPADLGMSVDASGGSAPTAAQMRRPLTQQVGDEATLDSLDIEPLPDEPLDVEYRTACRRFLVDVAANDPGIFRRRSRDETAAAAVTWVVTKANGLLEPYSGGLTAKQLAGWFGVRSSVSPRAAPMLRAVGVPPQTAYVRLGTPGPWSPKPAPGSSSAAIAGRAPALEHDPERASDIASRATAEPVAEARALRGGPARVRQGTDGKRRP